MISDFFTDMPLNELITFSSFQLLLKVYQPCLFIVKVKLSGDYELKSIVISDAAKNESQEIINDLIIAAYNNAKENLKKKSAEELSKITGGINLPLDFKLPF